MVKDPFTSAAAFQKRIATSMQERLPDEFRNALLERKPATTKMVFMNRSDAEISPSCLLASAFSRVTVAKKQPGTTANQISLKAFHLQQR